MNLVGFDWNKSTIIELDNQYNQYKNNYNSLCGGNEIDLNLDYNSNRKYKVIKYFEFQKHLISMIEIGKILNLIPVGLSMHLVFASQLV